MRGQQVELACDVVGPLWNVTASKPLIILRNARTHWKPLSLTVQELINSKLYFLGCLICNSRSLIFLSLFKNSFCGVVQGEKAGGHRSMGRGPLTDTVAEWRFWGAAGMQGCPWPCLTLNWQGSYGMCRTLRGEEPQPSPESLPFRGGRRGLPSPLASISGAFCRGPLLNYHHFLNPKPSWTTKQK